MIRFAVLATLLAAGLLVWLLWPARARGRVSTRDANISVYRDQLRELDADLAGGKITPQDHERSRKELEARLLADVAPAEAEAPRSRRAIPWAAGVAIPLAALAIYFGVGSPRMIDRQAEAPVTAQQVEAMVARLAAKLRENPDDTDGWKLLGRSYAVMGRYAESADAYARAATRAPRDPQLLADFAEVLAMSRGESMVGEPEKLALRALELDPRNIKALALAGTAAYERKDFDGAARTWRRMLPLVPAGGDDARAIQANIDEALAMKGGRVLRGEVRLAEKLKKSVSPDDAVFIFARAAEGPPMPLAVLKKRVRDLPLAFALDDTMAMAPGAKLSNFPRVVVSARISKSGLAAPQPGDLQGASAAVANDARGVRITIDSVVR
ncbi:MAG: cytochrome c-type biosis protein CcmH [Betaproteobacteria bacterium]|jgi:cytochrome c-type biogenesis protein CcmH|nr:cytochrome c-type biosis protein CcmH [Betaproteobacteria bacterium]